MIGVVVPAHNAPAATHGAAGRRIHRFAVFVEWLT